MIINNLKSLLGLLLIAIFTLSCGGNGSKDNDENDDTLSTSEAVQSAPADESAICLWSSLTLKETPDAKGKYKNTIYMGEKTIFLKETVIDSTDKKNKREYIKIRLSDGSEGWVQSNLMAVGAKTYVLRDKTKLYKRPDILSAGKDEFDKMQFVVVTEEQGEWAKVKGKKLSDGWFKEGWIKTDKLLDNDIDVTVAILAQRAMLKDTDEKKVEALQEIVDNSDFSSSIFVSDVQNLINNIANPEGQDSQEVEEYYEGD